MALYKAMPTDTGFAPTYHKITMTIINWTDRAAQLQFSSYKDADFRRSGGKPLGTFLIVLDKDLFPTADDPMRKDFYDAVKQLPDWTDATDI